MEETRHDRVRKNDFLELELVSTMRPEDGRQDNEETVTELVRLGDEMDETEEEERLEEGEDRIRDDEDRDKVDKDSRWTLVTVIVWRREGGGERDLRCGDTQFGVTVNLITERVWARGGDHLTHLEDISETILICESCGDDRSDDGVEDEESEMELDTNFGSHERGEEHESASDHEGIPTDVECCQSSLWEDFHGGGDVNPEDQVDIAAFDEENQEDVDDDNKEDEEIGEEESSGRVRVRGWEDQLFVGLCFSGEVEVRRRERRSWGGRERGADKFDSRTSSSGGPPRTTPNSDRLSLSSERNDREDKGEEDDCQEDQQDDRCIFVGEKGDRVEPAILIPGEGRMSMREERQKAREREREGDRDRGRQRQRETERERDRETERLIKKAGTHSCVPESKRSFMVR
jgi:hypothetical protein